MKGWLWGDGEGGGEVYCVECGLKQDFDMYFGEQVDPTFLFEIEDNDREHTVCDICGRDLDESEEERLAGLELERRIDERMEREV